MQKKVFVIGASGFVGSYVIEQLYKSNYDISLLLRNEKEKHMWEEKDMHPYIGDITDEESISSALKASEADTIVHLVGIIEEKKPHITFQNIHVEGTRHIVQSAKNAGIKKIMYVSALGASTDASTAYFQTKAQAENIIKASGIPYTIFRPSLIFGKHAGFTNQLIKSFHYLPFFPVIGKGDYRFMPIAGQVVGECIAQAIVEGKTINQTYELYGPETLTLKEIEKRLKESLGSHKPLIPIPLFMIQFMAFFSTLSLPVPITKDQLTMLRMGSHTDDKRMEKDFRVTPIPFDPKGSYPLY